eukprot:SAG22_NODE_359_length_11758_cov_4.094254_12_plen_200_part_00
MLQFAAMLSAACVLLGAARPQAASAQAWGCELNVTEGHCCPGGSSLGSMPAASTAECCQQCQNSTAAGKACGVFTFNKPEKTCWLKAAGGPFSSYTSDKCDCGHAGPLPPPAAPGHHHAPAINCSWTPQPNVGCAKRGGAGNGGWQIPAVDAAACCDACTHGLSGGSHPKCEAWTYLPYSYHANGVCLMSSLPDCQVSC